MEATVAVVDVLIPPGMGIFVDDTALGSNVLWGMRPSVHDRELSIS